MTENLPVATEDSEPSEDTPNAPAVPDEVKAAKKNKRALRKAFKGGKDAVLPRWQKKYGVTISPTELAKLAEHADVSTREGRIEACRQAYLLAAAEGNVQGMVNAARTAEYMDAVAKRHRVMQGGGQAQRLYIIDKQQQDTVRARAKEIEARVGLGKALPEPKDAQFEVKAEEKTQQQEEPAVAGNEARTT